MASPTFSLPEFIGGTRNWYVSHLYAKCYPPATDLQGLPVSNQSVTLLKMVPYVDFRASWIRDSSFTLYALIRLGFTHEANGKLYRLNLFSSPNLSLPFQLTWTSYSSELGPRTLTAPSKSCKSFNSC